MQKHRALLVQVITFGLVGITTLLIDISVTVFLYNIIGLPAYAASGIGFLSGFFFNFPMNRRRVFHHSVQDRFSLSSQIAMYIALCIFNLIMTSVLSEVLVSFDIVSIGIAKVIVTAMIAVWNFVFYKLIIFSKRSEQPS